MVKLHNCLSCMRETVWAMWVNCVDNENKASWVVCVYRRRAHNAAALCLSLSMFSCWWLLWRATIVVAPHQQVLPRRPAAAGSRACLADQPIIAETASSDHHLARWQESWRLATTAPLIGVLRSPGSIDRELATSVALICAEHGKKFVCGAHLPLSCCMNLQRISLEYRREAMTTTDRGTSQLTSIYRSSPASYTLSSVFGAAIVLSVIC